MRGAWRVLEVCLRGAWGVGPEDRYYNPEPQYTHSLIKLGSHTPETPGGSVDIYCIISLSLSMYIYIYIYLCVYSLSLPLSLCIYIYIYICVHLFWAIERPYVAL